MLAHTRPMQIEAGESYMRKAIAAGLCLWAGGCSDAKQEAVVVKRCETLLAAQELASLPQGLRADPRAPIKPKDAPRISNGEATTFVRRAYDRLTADAKEARTEPREYTCIYDNRVKQVVTLSTNGHQQELRLGAAEWAVASKRISLPK
jgi:hypothetical protein